MIPVNIPLVTEEDIQSVVEVMRDGWLSGEAPIVSEFENQFAHLHGQEFGIAVPNGSLAIDLVLHTIDLKIGDEVILPSFAIISCLAEIMRRGAKPVFVDSEPNTWNMDTKNLSAAVSRNTKAILVVHTYGLPTNMDAVTKVASQHGLPVIEDCAESHGLRFRSKPVGSFGLASTFSFYANKNVTTGEGGMVITSDESLANRLRYYRNLTFSPERRFVHEEVGWNLRFSAIQAALGLSQLRRLDQTIKRRREIGQRYRDALESIQGVDMAPPLIDYAQNDYWVVGAVLSQEKFGSARDVADSLAARGVQTRPFFFPLHRQPAYLRTADAKVWDLPVADMLGEQGLYFPNGLGMTDDQLEEAVRKTKEVLGN